MEDQRMSKDARIKAVEVSPAIAEKMKELAELIAAEQFGPQGIPKEISFSEIEEIGHQAGRLLASRVDHELVADHQGHFADAQACPQCGKACASQPQHRELVTRDGRVPLSEAGCYCVGCRRSFFPSASSAEA